MIDLQTESLLTLAQATRILPPGRNGRPTHFSTVYRWISRGLRGVKLEAARLGGRPYTSHEAMQRFSERLSDSLAVAVDGTTRIARRQAALQAERELIRLGF